MIAYRIQNGDLVKAADLEAAIAGRLAKRRWPVRLVTRNLIGKLIAKGPMRAPAKAAAPFAATITNIDPKVSMGRFWRVRGLLAVLFRIDSFAAWLGDFVMQDAEKELGVPYHFGAENGPDDVGPDSFDCSGFTREFWNAHGANLIHAARSQQEQCTRISLDEAENGDLVFMWFKNSRGIQKPNASHVGFFHGVVRDNRGRVAAVMLLDTRSMSEPVAFRTQDLDAIVGYGRPVVSA